MDFVIIFSPRKEKALVFSRYAKIDVANLMIYSLLTLSDHDQTVESLPSKLRRQHEPNIHINILFLVSDLF